MDFLQSPAWADFQRSLGRQVFTDSGEGWHYLAILERGRGNTRLYCPYGPVAGDQKSFDSAVESLKNLAKEQRITFIRIEPTNTDLLPHLEQTGWKKMDYQSLNPEHTSIIDLSREKDDIISSMSQPVRNIYRNYHKKGLEVRNSHDPADIKTFLDLIHKVAERTGMRPHSDTYFQKQAASLLPDGHATLWVAEHSDSPIAAALTYDDESTRYYAHAAADLSPELRKLNAATAIVAEAIIDAKEKGLRQFDLYGIAPDDSPADHPWKGFTRFKRSFGGDDISHCGTWDLPINNLVYSLYKAQQKIRKLF